MGAVAAVSGLSDFDTPVNELRGELMRPTEVLWKAAESEIKALRARLSDLAAERDQARHVARRQHQRIRRAELAGILGLDRHHDLPDWLTEQDPA